MHDSRLNPQIVRTFPDSKQQFRVRHLLLERRDQLGLEARVLRQKLLTKSDEVQGSGRNALLIATHRAIFLPHQVIQFCARTPPFNVGCSIEFELDSRSV